MDCKGPKQKLQGRPSQEDSENGERERKRPRSDDNGDEAQQFFALVDKIQAMKRLLKQKRMNGISAQDISSTEEDVNAGISAQDISSTEENVNANVIKRKSPWRPSFEWEDFSSLPWKGSPSEQRDLSSCTNKTATSSGVSEKPDKNMGIDLNVEATS